MPEQPAQPDPTHDPKGVPDDNRGDEGEPVLTDDDLPASHREQARRIWTVTRMGLLSLFRSHLPRMAAALAFRTIFSIIPVMAIGLLIFGSVVSDDQVEQGVRRVLEFAGVSQISTVESDPIEDPGERSPGETMEDLQEQAAEQREEAADQTPENNPFGAADIEEVITDLINRVNQSIREVPTGWIALTSGLVLLYAAMSMLIEMEKSFNQICSAPSGRSWLRRLMLYWTILTAGTLLLAATFLVGDALTQWVLSFAGQDSLVGAMMAGYGVSVLISTLLLLGAYTTIPNTKIHLRTALAGAFMAAVLWELGKLGFTAYLRYSTNYAKFYGSLAILPLFLLWVYVTWLIVLFGMQATYTLQNFSRLVDTKLKALNEEDQREPVLIDPLVMLVIAKLVQRSFEHGKPIDADRVSDLTKLGTAQSTELLEAMSDAGILSRIYKGDTFHGWSPTRPADRILLREILEAAYRMDAFRISAADHELPKDIVDAATGVCDGKTIADLLEACKPEPDPAGRETRNPAG